MKNQEGSALVISFIIMALLAALIVGFSRNTDIDLLVGRNSRLLKQAFQWSDSGLEIAQERISISEDRRGVNEPLTFNLNFIDDNNLYGTISSTIFNATNATITIREDDSSGKVLSTVNVRNIGSIVNDGTSIIFAAGYEGAGKGAGAGGTIARIYSLRSRGFSDSDSEKRSASIYRSVASGK